MSDIFANSAAEEKKCYTFSMSLTQTQKEQVLQQLKRHMRPSAMRVIHLCNNRTITLKINEGVFASDIMSSGIFLARFLDERPDLYQAKTVLDVGCGAGIQGIVTAMNGASQVVMTDINPEAAANAHENIALLGLGNVHAYLGDLFESIPTKTRYDCIIFNHPFFPETAEAFENDPTNNPVLRRSMLGGTDLIRRFFQEVSAHLEDKGIIIMPYFQLAGPENCPMTHAQDYGFNVTRQIDFSSNEGLQIGEFSIYILSRT